MKHNTQVTFLVVFPALSITDPKQCASLALITVSFLSVRSAEQRSREELQLLAIGDIINELVEAHQQQRDVNLSRLKTRISARYGLDTSPRLVDIIAAVPQQHRAALVPKLKAKPIRTASGVSIERRCLRLACALHSLIAFINIDDVF